MTKKEEAIINKEKKQLKAFIDCLRTESDAIGVKLAEMIKLIAGIRESQLGIDLLIRELEAKLKK